MSTTINNFQNQSWTGGFLGKFRGFLWGGLTKKILLELSKNLETSNDSDIEFLEELNSNDELNISHIDKFEEIIAERKFLADMLDRIYQEMSRQKGNLSRDEKYYNEIIHINNAVYTLMETNKKVHLKLDEIHNKILIGASENISTEVLDEIWEGEDQLWDEFYVHSKKSK